MDRKHGLNGLQASYSISEVAKSTGVTSRTLRHYDQIGLLRPQFVARNGYRHYGQNELVRLQRILLLRQLGLRLDTIAEVLDSKTDQVQALQAHVQDLNSQRENIDRQISALHHSINSLQNGEVMNLDSAFEGFNEQYKDEVISRWGSEAYERSDQWWRSKNAADRSAFMEQVKELNQAWVHAGSSGISANSPEAQQLAARHVQWLGRVPGTPAASGDQDQTKAYVLGLADLYVTDERFARNYQGHAPFVRDALHSFINGIKN
ncbi:MerR family transcriptional regulator [Glutamicibacter sp. NPDC087344]|uniref:MerR family transcriptional regulator n=1 Tax=Glutamicibacter sp. NPDC087344 TaxID=3363994 RepID=UPI003815AAE3